MKRKIAGIAFVALSIAIMSVSAYVYESATSNVGQTVIDVATLTLTPDLTLGALEEGQSLTFTKNEISALGGALQLTTANADTVLGLNSDIDKFVTDPTYPYEGYTVVIKNAADSSIVATLTIGAPDDSVTLGAAGSYVFDIEFTTEAKSGLSGTSNLTPSATLIVTAESP